MGIFWTYLRDTLRLPAIQQPGPLAMLADGGATTLDSARDVALQLRDQFFAERCEVAYLANFARRRGIVRGQLEPESSYHSRVRLAYLWHVQGGRESGMRQVLCDLFGFAETTVVNLRHEDPARWAEFRVVCDVGLGINPDISFEQVEWAVNETKPARSRLAEIRITTVVLSNIPALTFAMISTEVIEVFDVSAPLIELLQDEVNGELLYDESGGGVLYYTLDA